MGIETVRSEIDIFVSSTGIFNIISAIKHVDHDELWLALLREFGQQGAHAPWLQVVAMETAVSETDIFASSTCTTSSLWWRNRLGRLRGLEGMIVASKPQTIVSSLRAIVPASGL